ncbi:FecR family protein [Spirosoma sp. KNUC1025]|uniref:FecR family protein n=1 Tax=Spirosoma sp. KNUC1025 TaxID=2894082 RepID=UPI003864B874|nr:FecR domain-containing protein [Spirosoma sp. KNUC1025]
MSRKKFGQLLQKYLRGECTPAEKAFVEHWYGLLETETSATGEELDMDELENRLWNQIQRKMDTEPAYNEGRVLPLHTVRYRWIGVAALLLLIGWWYFFYPASQKFPTVDSPVAGSKPGWIERTNTTGQPLVVRLEDGSTVRLAARSAVRFPTHFTKEKRTVYLTGDAFFEVARMPARPFYVHTGSVVTKVLGTSFFVRSQSATKQVRVEVVTGRVAVYQETPRQQTANGVVLRPNQAATFFEKEQHFVTGLVDAPRIIQTPEVEKKPITFRYDDAPLSDVLMQLEQAYGITIEVENESQNACPLTADLTDQPLYTQLEIICAALKARYEVRGTTILISGKGCEN